MDLSRRTLGSLAGKAASRRRGGRSRGFTLLETSLALVIIGVGVLAFVDAQKNFIHNNEWSSHAATGAYLANEIRELTRRLPRHDPVTGLYAVTQGTGNVLMGWGPEDGEVLATDYDDLDDFDGAIFGEGGRFAGPVNASGEVVPQMNADGTPVLDDEGNPVPLQGWTQSIFVEKVDPLNYALIRADSYSEDPSGTFAGRAVGDYPLRITVIVEYQGPFDAHPEEVTRAQWIVPP